MYIEPNTTIRLLKNCPLDSTYEHTIYFDINTRYAQANYFILLTKYTLTNMSYQRSGKGTIRVAYKVEDLYDCNYLMFQNTAFGDKWFYAFIKGVEYINNNTSEIQYEIDVMQTWMFDYKLEQCFVEREHTASDEIGEHTVPENIETGPFVVTATSNYVAQNLSVYILSTVGPPGVGSDYAELESISLWHEPAMMGGFPMPCWWTTLGFLDESDHDKIARIMEIFDKNGQGESIVAMFCAPSNMVTTGTNVMSKLFDCAPRTLSFIPKNKKLYSYPYCSLAVHSVGQGVELRYELFDGDTPQMKLFYGFGADTQVFCCPYQYGGKTESIELGVTLKNFPIIPWKSDYYKNWWALHKGEVIVGTIVGVAGFLIGAAGQNGSQMMGGATTVANNIVSVYQHKKIPDQMVGSASAPDILAVAGQSGFYTSCVSVTEEYGRIIDNYFTMYGYKVNTLKVPNRNVRKYWTYTKTAGCLIEGSIPSDARKKICEIYDKGITFWTHGSNIGAYNLNNEIVS